MQISIISNCIQLNKIPTVLLLTVFFICVPIKPPAIAQIIINGAISKLYAAKPVPKRIAVSLAICAKKIVIRLAKVAVFISNENKYISKATFIGPPPIPKNEDNKPKTIPAAANTNAEEKR